MQRVWAMGREQGANLLHVNGYFRRQTAHLHRRNDAIGPVGIQRANSAPPRCPHPAVVPRSCNQTPCHRLHRTYAHSASAQLKSYLSGFKPISHPASSAVRRRRAPQATVGFLPRPAVHMSALEISHVTFVHTTFLDVYDHLPPIAQYYHSILLPPPSPSYTSARPNWPPRAKTFTPVDFPLWNFIEPPILTAIPYSRL